MSGRKVSNNKTTTKTKEFFINCKFFQPDSMINVAHVLDVNIPYSISCEVSTGCTDLKTVFL